VYAFYELKNEINVSFETIKKIKRDGKNNMSKK
jgi:hypothetical protein